MPFLGMQTCYTKVMESKLIRKKPQNISEWQSIKTTLIAADKYGDMLYGDDGIPSDKKETAKYFKMIANKGIEDGMYEGDGVASNQKEAAKYLKMHDYKYHTDAIYRYAYMLFIGDNLEVDKKESQRYFKITPNKGNEYAINFYTT